MNHNSQNFSIIKKKSKENKEKKKFHHPEKVSKPYTNIYISKCDVLFRQESTTRRGE